MVQALVDVILTAIAPVTNRTAAREIRFSFFADALVLTRIRIAVLTVLASFATKLWWTLALEVIVSAIEDV